MVLVNGSEEKLIEIKVIFIHDDQLNYLHNLRKLTTVHNSQFVCNSI
jgi:hypothetical protein